MDNNILLIDSQPEISLLREVIYTLSLPFQLTGCKSFSEALKEMEVRHPDLLMISSGIIIEHGFEIPIHVGSIPAIILCEVEGFDKLMKKHLGDVLFLTRPFCLDEIPELLISAMEFLYLFKEKRHVFPKDKW